MAGAKPLKPTHPEITEAAVIAIAHPQWDERPLVVAVRRKGSRLTARDLLAFLRRQDREVVDAGRCTVRRRASARGDRKGPEDQIARALRKPRSRRDTPDQNAVSLERAKGIEPSYAAWEAAVLPLNYARELPQKIRHFSRF